jgi:octaprenyl-diphosphate synthase
MERVNGVILARTGSEVTMIPEVANHLINSGGKRLRPMLTLALARLTGYAGDGHIKLAAAVEFMHTATLLHDDVVDESELRRGRLAARMLWGNEASVLVGDFLLGQAFKMMVEVGSLKALEILSSAAAVIAEGEVMQLAAAKNTATTEDEYIAVIRAKTAELFAAACEVGPALSARQKAEQTACRSFGMNLGITFQLVDDVLDYGGAAAKLGKNVGDDFREGKITLPVVLAFRRGGDAEREFWRRTLERGESDRRRPRTRHRADDQASRARGHDRPRIPLRRHRPRRARAVSRFADEIGARRDGRFLHRAHALALTTASSTAQRARIRRKDLHQSEVWCARLPPLRGPRLRRRTEQSRSRPSRTCGPGCNRAARAAPQHLGNGRRERDGGLLPDRSPAPREAAKAIAARQLGDRGKVERRRKRRGRLPFGKHRLGRQRHAGIDQHRRQLRQGKRRREQPRRCRA